MDDPVKEGQKQDNVDSQVQAVTPDIDLNAPPKAGEQDATTAQPKKQPFGHTEQQRRQAQAARRDRMMADQARELKTLRDQQSQLGDSIRQLTDLLGQQARQQSPQRPQPSNNVPGLLGKSREQLEQDGVDETVIEAVETMRGMYEQIHGVSQQVSEFGRFVSDARPVIETTRTTALRGEFAKHFPDVDYEAAADLAGAEMREILDASPNLPVEARNRMMMMSLRNAALQLQLEGGIDDSDEPGDADHGAAGQDQDQTVTRAASQQTGQRAGTQLLATGVPPKGVSGPSQPQDEARNVASVVTEAFKVLRRRGR